MGYVMISLILGITSWIIAIWNCRNEEEKKVKYVVISFLLSLCSIYPQILLMSSYGDNWVPVIDTVGALKTVIPIFLIGVILVMYNGNWAITLLGSIWIIFGVGLKIKSIYNNHKLENLKRDGLCYEGTVVKIN